MSKKYQEVFNNIKKNSLKPVYLIHGEETFYADTLTNKIIDLAIPVHEKGFNEFILFGKDINTGTLLNYARRYPMMAEKQLIVVKDAHQIQDINLKENQTLLEDYALKPLPSTILVLKFGTAQDERKAWVKSFNKNGVLVNFKKLYDNELPEFVSDYCHQKGVKISMKAIQLLVEHIGNDLKRLSKEIDKVILNLKLEDGIDAGVIEKYVGISKDYNIFELQKSLIARDVLKSNQIINSFTKNLKEHPIQPMLIILYNFFSKVLLAHSISDKSEFNLAKALGVNTFFVKDYIMAIRNYSLAKTAAIIHEIRVADGKSKGVDSGGDDESALLRDLIFKILH